MSRIEVSRRSVLGVDIAAIDYAGAVGLILQAARDRDALGASALAVDAVMRAHADPAYRARLNALDLALPDGQPVRWALNWLYHTRLGDRVYGPELMERLCAAAAAEGLPVFLFGSTAEVLGAAAARLASRHPGLAIAGIRASRFRRITAAEAEADAALIAGSGARLVFCGLGCPRQEEWVDAMRPRLAMPLVAVGAAFPLAAGQRAMAPAWMQRRGLEWLFRLGQEPVRLAERYLTRNPAFVLALTRQKLRPAYRPPTPPAGPPSLWG